LAKLPRPIEDPGLVALSYTIACVNDDWTLPDDVPPETRPHRLRRAEMEQLLAGWAARSGRSIRVGARHPISWDADHPRMGVIPDVYVVEPVPPEGKEPASLRLWEPGHAPPLLAVEIVAAHHPYEDYVSTPDKYAASGIEELWILDPGLEGPRAHGGPFRLHVWCRDGDEFARVYAGDGPARSDAVGAWLHTVDGGRRVRIADDEQGTSWWLTPSEAELARRKLPR